MTANMRNSGVAVAIKIINRPLTEARESILAEVQIMKMCNHHHIVDLVDALVWKDVCYLVMRYCKKPNVCQCLASLMAVALQAMVARWRS